MTWKPATSQLQIAIETDGPLKALGHDRVFQVPVDVSIAGERTDAQVEAQGDLLQTDVEGEVADRDRKDMLKRMHGDVLQTKRFPHVTYAGRLAEAGSRLTGKLTLRGVTQPCDLPLTLTWDEDRFEAAGERTLDLADFGMRPYKALLGALRVKTTVTVSYRVDGVHSTGEG